MHDLPVLEMDLGQRAADLGPQLDPVDRRELAEETGPDIDLALQGLADGHDRGGRRRRHSLVSAVGREAEPGEEQPRRYGGADRPDLPSPPARLRHRFVQPFSFEVFRVGDLIHETILKSLPCCPEFGWGTNRAASRARRPLWGVEGGAGSLSFARWKSCALG